MTKPNTDPKSSEPGPAEMAIVDTGKAPAASAEAPVAAPHETEAPPHKHGKHVKVDPAELESLRTKAADADKYYDQLLRARAEFDNYRKRVVQEKQYAELAANQKLLQKLIGILDTFDLAVASADKAESAKAVLDGIRLVQGQLQNALKDSGLETIDALNVKFDPNLHEAISQVESAEHPDDTVVQQVRKGYRFKDRLLRPAAVIVSKKPEPR